MDTVDFVKLIKKEPYLNVEFFLVHVKITIFDYIDENGIPQDNLIYNLLKLIRRFKLFVDTVSVRKNKKA